MICKPLNCIRIGDIQLIDWGHEITGIDVKEALPDYAGRDELDLFFAGAISDNLSYNGMQQLIQAKDVLLEEVLESLRRINQLPDHKPSKPGKFPPVEDRKQKSADKSMQLLFQRLILTHTNGRRIVHQAAFMAVLEDSCIQFLFP